MRKLYVYHTEIGPFYIAELQGRFHVLYREESLGSYTTPSSAADDVAGGHTFSIRGGVNTATLGIPRDLNRWQRLSDEHRKGSAS